MPTFAYKAKNGPDKTVEGELIAESRATAIARIDAMGYSPVWIREKQQESGKGRGFWERRISERDITVFTRQLASLTRSGVPILKALSTIGEQTENYRLARVIQTLEDTVRDGDMLSAALAQHPSLFPEIYINMARSGEAGGVLDTVLNRLADARDKNDELRRRIQAAMAYPTLILAVGIGTVFVLLTFFMPQVIDLFKDYRNLPLATRALIGISNFFSHYWYWIALVCFLIMAVLWRLAAMEKGKTFIDRIMLHAPFISRFVRLADIARFGRTLSLLINTGIPVDKALALSGATLNNTVLRDEIEKVRHDTVQQGMPLSAGLKRSRYFPALVANMAAVGEEAGRLDESLAEVASFYEKELDQRSRLAASLIEPILILVVGAVVGFIVSAMLLPIFEIGKAF